MRDKLASLIDKPVVIKIGTGATGTVGDVGFTVKAETVQGTVLDVGEELVDVLIAPGTMRSLRIDVIAEVSLSSFLARHLTLEDPPADEGWPKAKRLLFEAEELINLAQPRPIVAAKAEQALDLLRRLRASFPRHRGVASRLERAHFLATGRYDHERHEEVTGGDVDDAAYEAARDHAAKLEKALQARRPEPEIAVLLPPLARAATRALARYPNHALLRGWLERAEAIRARLSPATQRRTYEDDSGTGFLSLAEPFMTANQGG